MRLRFYIILGLAAILASSCHKDWLDIKRDKRQVVPATLKDIEALLGNSQVMTERMPYLGELASGDFYLDDIRIQILDDLIRSTHLWTNESYGNLRVLDWNNRHEQIFYANTALAALDRLSEQSSTELWQHLHGSALFYRAWGVYQLAQLFCKPYDPLSAHADPGIPFLLEADVNLRAQRGTVQQTYDRILSDLRESIPALPDKASIPTKPSKAAAYGLLARTYLLMANYQEALLSLNKALAIQHELIDYNTLDTLSISPFERFNKEVVFRSTMTETSSLMQPYFHLHADLFQIYSVHDLRNKLYFDLDVPQGWFKGSYDGGAAFFCGIATDELYLMKAECLARNGQIDESISTLNYLLRHRYKSGYHSPYDSMPLSDLVNSIIDERRKSLCFRGLRWTDLRRLSLEPAHSITLLREINGQTFELSPQFPNYVIYIPDVEIQLNPMEQNIRY